MPYFRLTALSRAFVEVLADDELQQLLPADAVPFKATVLASEGRAKSMVLFFRIRGRKKFQAEPDWSSTQFSAALADELKVDTLEQVCVYDSEDDQFHPTDVTPRRSPQVLNSQGLLGWHDLEPQFVVEGLSPQNRNLILRALALGKCLPRSTFSEQLPQQA